MHYQSKHENCSKNLNFQKRHVSPKVVSQNDSPFFVEKPAIFFITLAATLRICTIWAKKQTSQGLRRAVFQVDLLILCWGRLFEELSRKKVRTRNSGVVFFPFATEKWGWTNGAEQQKKLNMSMADNVIKHRVAPMATSPAKGSKKTFGLQLAQEKWNPNRTLYIYIYLTKNLLPKISDQKQRFLNSPGSYNGFELTAEPRWFRPPARCWPSFHSSVGPQFIHLKKEKNDLLKQQIHWFLFVLVLSKWLPNDMMWFFKFL